MKIGISSSCLYPMYTEESFRLIAQQGVELSEIFFNANFRKLIVNCRINLFMDN